MRIVAHNGARIWGGAERATVMLLRGLSDRGHDVALLANDDLVRREAEALGVASELCPIGGDVAFHHAIRLSRVLRRREPDAFLIGTWKKLFLASLGARIAEVPHVVARVGLETDTARSVKYRFALARWVDGVVVNADRMSSAFLTLGGFGPARVRLIHNGVRRPHGLPEEGAMRRSLGIDDGAFVVGTIARLVEQKRIDRLLAALALTDGLVHCIIAGDGARHEDLLRQAAALRITERVHFLGHREDKAAVLDALDVFVVASDREGLSNAMLEAMSVGLPVISTPVSGAADALEGDPPAGVITTFEPASIARAIDDLRRNSVRRSGMAAEAARRAETTFSFERMLDAWEKFLSRSDS